MNLYTTCNACRTTFKVNTSQLRQSAGQVRCGYCKNIFDAFDTLTSHVPKNSEKLRKIPLPNKKTFEDHLQASSLGGEIVENVTQDDRQDEINLYETEFRMNPKSRRGVYFWLILFFIGLAGMQGAFLKRQIIVEKYPIIYEKIISHCRIPECGSNYIDTTTWLDIESSDLVIIDSSGVKVAKLEALVRNKAFFTLRYPTVAIFLLDESGGVVSHKLFLPYDYVLEYDPNVGFPPDSELVIDLKFNVDEGVITDYRMTLTPNQQIMKL